mgnify:CR=1 FL=1
MFKNLSDRLGQTLDRIRGQGRLTEDNIKETLREIRMALLEADVSLPVVKQFVERVRERAVGQEVMQSLTPGQALVKIVNDELVSIMGEACDELQLNVQPPAVVLMAGLQGSGKTTSTAKLARWLRERKKKSVLVTSCDIYRPAAIHQLEKLAGEVEADFFPSTTEDDPVAIAKASLDHARRKHLDVLIVDLPPGTGDVQMTLAQKAHVDGAIIVSTPQDVALLDARKGIDMFNQLKTPIIGMIENMSTHICSNCGHEEHVFGHGGVAAEAEKLGVPLLSEIPLHLDIRLAADGGAPIVVSKPDSPQANAFRDVARDLIAKGHA